MRECVCVRVSACVCVCVHVCACEGVKGMYISLVPDEEGFYLQFSWLEGYSLRLIPTNLMETIKTIPSYSPIIHVWYMGASPTCAVNRIY